jgi:hypothetical protein
VVVAEQVVLQVLLTTQQVAAVQVLTTLITVLVLEVLLHFIMQVVVLHQVVDKGRMVVGEQDFLETELALTREFLTTLVDRAVLAEVAVVAFLTTVLLMVLVVMVQFWFTTKE